MSMDKPRDFHNTWQWTALAVWLAMMIATQTGPDLSIAERLSVAGLSGAYAMIPAILLGAVFTVVWFGAKGLPERLTHPDYRP
jgi:hypothetical protein